MDFFFHLFCRYKQPSMNITVLKCPLQYIPITHCCIRPSTMIPECLQHFLFQNPVFRKPGIPVLQNVHPHSSSFPFSHFPFLISSFPSAFLHPYFIPSKKFCVHPSFSKLNCSSFPMYSLRFLR